MAGSAIHYPSTQEVHMNTNKYDKPVMQLSHSRPVTNFAGEAVERIQAGIIILCLVLAVLLGSGAI
jgi:hypothetical protein